MTATPTDQRARLHTDRAHQQARLTELQHQRAKVCGCWVCGDADRGTDLDVRLAHVQALIDQATDQLCQRS